MELEPRPFPVCGWNHCKYQGTGDKAPLLAPKENKKNLINIVAQQKL